MRRLGFTLIELLAGIVIFAVVLAGLLAAELTMWNTQNKSIGLPANQASAEQMAMKLANAFRSATYCTATDSGCTLNSGVDSATATSCDIYSRNSSGTLVVTSYAISGTNFNQTVGGVTTTLATNATLALTYFTSTSSTAYNTTALTTFAPSSSTVTNLIAVQIVATVSTSGANSTYTTFVRLRNGP